MVKGFEVGDPKLGHAFLGTEGVEAVTGVAKHRPAHRAKAALQQLIFLRLDGGKLQFALALERRGGKSRVQHHIGDQAQSLAEIAGQHFGAHPETVVAAKAVDAPA